MCVCVFMCRYFFWNRICKSFFAYIGGWSVTLQFCLSFKFISRLGGVTAGLCTDASIARTKIRWCQHNNHKSLTTKIKWFAFQIDLKSTLSWTIQISFILVTLRKVKACHLKLVTPNDCSDCISLNKVQGNSFFLGSVFGLKIGCVR